MQVAIELRCLPLCQRSGASLCGKLIDALAVCLRKLDRQKIPGDIGRNGAFVGLDHAGQNRRFRIRCDDLRTHTSQQLSPIAQSAGVAEDAHHFIVSRQLVHRGGEAGRLSKDR